MITIIIPANNEEQVIGLTLEGLLPGIKSGDFEVIVVCNACTDRTAAIVRSMSERIICKQVDTASKTNALNEGDASATYFPRVYLDADIRISYSDIIRLTRELKNEKLLAVSPYIQMDTYHSSRIVKAYYDVWANLPYCREGLIGAGVYALSEKGRARFGAFPDILADDGFVRLQFGVEKRGAVNNVTSIVTAPTHLMGLIKIKTRSRLGEYELKKKFPELYINDRKKYGMAIKNLFGNVAMWPKALVYLGVNLITRIRARKQIKTKGFSYWERDDSSRGKIRW